jgi:hypothetical protein
MNMTDLIRCPFCGMKVVPMHDGVCPACQKSLRTIPPTQLDASPIRDESSASKDSGEASTPMVSLESPKTNLRGRCVLLASIAAAPVIVATWAILWHIAENATNLNGLTVTCSWFPGICAFFLAHCFFEKRFRAANAISPPTIAQRVLVGVYVGVLAAIINYVSYVLAACRLGYLDGPATLATAWRYFAHPGNLPLLSSKPIIGICVTMYDGVEYAIIFYVAGIWSRKKIGENWTQRKTLQGTVPSRTGLAILGAILAAIIGLMLIASLL